MNEYEKEKEWKKKVNLKECNCCETCKYSTPIDDRESICKFETEIHYVSDIVFVIILIRMKITDE